MYSQVKSGSLYGLDSEMVIAETDISQGLPSFHVVGLPDISVKESKERIRAAMINSGFRFPAKRITVNLVPAGAKKEGTHFDLPIAVSVMIGSGILNSSKINEYAFLGELSLDGRINCINGVLPLVIGLRNKGINKIILPAMNLKEALAVQDISFYPVRHLKEVESHFNGEEPLSVCSGSISESPKRNLQCGDFSDVAGQETVKRAFQIAAAAVHNVLLIGTPGAGKTMMARRIPSILPEMTYEEKLEVTKIYSVSGALTPDVPIIEERPFRAPHHTVSGAALIGGGGSPKPGEVSLAHYGVLFLDELPEFNRYVLEMLRQPIEDEKVTISRIRGTVIYPSKFMLLASMNPCPCGYFGDETHECTCSPQQIRNYLSKISGPLLDRIDMHIEIMPVKYKDLEVSGENQDQLKDSDFNEKSKIQNDSKSMRLEVELARQIQLERYQKEAISYNSQLTPELMKKYCAMDQSTKNLLEAAFHRLSLSARSYHKIVKMGRTIADMEGSSEIQLNHIAEAIQYRSLDKMYRGL